MLYYGRIEIMGANDAIELLVKAWPRSGIGWWDDSWIHFASLLRARRSERGDNRFNAKRCMETFLDDSQYVRLLNIATQGARVEMYLLVIDLCPISVHYIVNKNFMYIGLLVSTGIALEQMHDYHAPLRCESMSESWRGRFHQSQHFAFH